MIDRGIDLLADGPPADAEVQEFRASYDSSHGGVPAAYDFWLEFDPVVVKYHRLGAIYTSSDDQRAIPLHGTLGFLHLYIIFGYEEGIRYEVEHSRSLGASKQAILQVMEIAFIQCGPRGIEAVRSAAGDLLRAWREPTGTMAFPEQWCSDPEAYRINYDMSRAVMDDSELQATRRWYEDKLGEMPGYANYLLRRRPGLLKAFHNRLAKAMSGPLPAQIYPFIQLQLSAARSDGQAMREAYLLGRHLAMTNDELAEAVAWGTMYGGISSCSAFTAAAGGVIGEW
jgi:hypothetical protein